MGDFTWEDVHQLRSKGWTHQRIATELGASRSTVSRILGAGPPVELPPGPRLLEVERIARDLADADPVTRAKLGLARSLGAKLDQAQEQRSAASAVAMANLARQYRETLNDLRAIASNDMERLVQALMGDVDSPAEFYRGVLSQIATGGLTPPNATPLTAEQLRACAREALEKGGYE